MLGFALLSPTYEIIIVFPLRLRASAPFALLPPNSHASRGMSGYATLT